MINRISTELEIKEFSSVGVKTNSGLGRIGFEEELKKIQIILVKNYFDIF